MQQNLFFASSGLGLPEDIALLKAHGDFDHAIRLIDQRLEGPLPTAMRENYEVQREIMRRLPSNYPFTMEKALARVQEEIPDFTMDELQHYMDIGRATWIYVDGEPHLVRSFFGTMRKRPEIAARCKQNEATGTEDRAEVDLLEHAAEVMRAKGSMSADITIRHSVTVKDEFFVPGETYRIHIPLPAKCIQQQEIEILSVDPAPTKIADEEADQRTIFWEETMFRNHSFTVEYRYRHRAPYVNPAKVQADAVQPDFCTEEIAPHIVFTPFVKALVAELTAGLTDPIAKARKFYDYVTTQVDYSFMPDYFVCPDIADNCLKTRRGDCGVQALAFVTLCRCAGIPAKWQSGMYVLPDYAGCHDWAMFYVAPYGWMFADPSFGGSAYRKGNLARQDHYFGNLDIFRNVTVNGYQRPFDPPCYFWRHDPYDNQIGEVEDSRRGYRDFEVRHDMKTVAFRELEE